MGIIVGPTTALARVPRLRAICRGTNQPFAMSAMARGLLDSQGGCGGGDSVNALRETSDSAEIVKAACPVMPEWGWTPAMAAHRATASAALQLPPATKRSPVVAVATPAHSPLPRSSSKMRTRLVRAAAQQRGIPKEGLRHAVAEGPCGIQARAREGR